MPWRFKKLNRIEKSSDPFAIQTGKYKNGKIEPIYNRGWAEDVFITDNQEKEKVGKNFDFRNLRLLMLALLCAFFLLIGRTAWLQIVKREYYYSMAEGNRIRIERVEPKRGVIYDRQNRTLVRNKPNFMLYFVPADLPKDDNEFNSILGSISKTIPEINMDEVKTELGKIGRRSLEAYQPLFIKDNIDYEKAMSLYLESANWPGVILTNKTAREYLFSPAINKESDPAELSNYLLSLSHILGYTGKISSTELEKYGNEYLPIDYIGKMGIEYFWENELRGKSGKKQIEVDALGKEVKILGEVPAEPGNNLVLSVDLEAQLKLEEIIKKYLTKLKLTKASGIIMDPNNGEIIAMVSLPSFNNNVFAQGISQKDYEALMNQPDKPLFNRAISGEYPSGSTIKPVMSAAALQEGIINEHTTVLSTGGIRIGEWFFPDWKAGGHGTTDVKRAIAESINTFFYYIGGGYQDFNGLGVERITEYEKLFGLGVQTGVDLAGEASGFLPSKEWKESTKKENWYIGDTYHLSIGQGDLLVTPLQVAAYTSVFANGGKLYRPHFLHELRSNDGQTVNTINEPPVRENFISENNINIVREGMRQTVTSGSGRRLNTLSVTSAGKTGTAQWSEKKNTHAWYTGFAPYEKPEITITLLVEEGGGGDVVGVSIAQEFLQWYFDEYKKKK